MLEYVILFLIAGLGSDDFTTRCKSEAVLTGLVIAVDDVSLLRENLRHPDPEVVSRCRNILAAYARVDVPEGLSLYWFTPDPSWADPTWKEANSYPPGPDGSIYVALMIKHGRWTRAEAQRQIRLAKARKFWRPVDNFLLEQAYKLGLRESPYPESQE